MLTASFAGEGYASVRQAAQVAWLGIAAKDFARDMAIGAAPRWLSLLGWSGAGKTHLARGIFFFKANASVYIDPETGAHLSRRGGFIGWRKIIDHLRDGDYEIMRVVCDDWFVALHDIGAERASDFSVSKLLDTRLVPRRKWLDGEVAWISLVLSFLGRPPIPTAGASGSNLRRPWWEAGVSRFSIRWSNFAKKFASAAETFSRFISPLRTMLFWIVT